MFTPGDNDWTDCDRPATAASLARTARPRARVLFGTPLSLGQRKLRQDVQTDALCLGFGGPRPCVENRRWTVGRVTYATLNVQGSCNNLCDTAPDPAEFTARNAANIKWMRESFAVATTRGSAAVMIISQANPGWDASDRHAPRCAMRRRWRKPTAHRRLQGLPARVARRGGGLSQPVAYVHGDSHYHRIDKPFLNAAGLRLENFTRIETFGNNAASGNNDVQWIKVTVQPKSREVFSYQAQIVPGTAPRCRRPDLGGARPAARCRRCADPTYGADANGLICGFRFSPHAPVESFDSAGARVGWPSAAGRESEFLWLHFNLSHAASLDWLRARSAGRGILRSARRRLTLDAHRASGRLGVRGVERPDLRLRVRGQRRGHAVGQRARRCRDHRTPAPAALGRSAAHGGQARRACRQCRRPLNHLLRDQADELQRIVRQASDRSMTSKTRCSSAATAALGRGAGAAAAHEPAAAASCGCWRRSERVLPHALAGTHRRGCRTTVPAAAPAPGVCRVLSSSCVTLARAAGAHQALGGRVGRARGRAEQPQPVHPHDGHGAGAADQPRLRPAPACNAGGLPFSQNAHGFWWVLAMITLVTLAIAWFALRRLAPRG